MFNAFLGNLCIVEPFNRMVPCLFGHAVMQPCNPSMTGTLRVAWKCRCGAAADGLPAFSVATSVPERAVANLKDVQ